MAPKKAGAGPVPEVLTQILRDRTIDVAFQPIVHMDSHEIVAFEALARGPVGSALAAPAALFAEAYRHGLAKELDWVCRAAALRAFLAADLPEPVALLANAEPTGLGSACPADLEPTFAAAAARRRVVVLEITERAVAGNPAGLLAGIEQARNRSMGLALDDVGADPGSLAMMPLMRPDVIKLDLSLIQGRATRGVARVVNAVLAEAERTGAAILAEGIESEHHVRVAEAMGATFGQGWFFGMPGPLPDRLPSPKHSIDIRAVPVADAVTPFDAAAGRRLSRATTSLLLPLSKHLEFKGLDATEPTVVLACFQDARRFNAVTRERFGRLASRAVFTAVLGRDMPPEPAPGVHGARLDPADPITHEWILIVLGPHFAAALLARQCDEEAMDRNRAFDFVVTHDRDVVIAAARPLLKRVVTQ